MQGLAELDAQLASTEVHTRRAAAERAAHYGPDAQPLAVALVRACGDEDEQVREWASGALEGLGPPPANAVDELAALLAHPQSDVGYWAATLLGRLKQSGAGAVPALIETLDRSPTAAVRQRVAWALRQIGPAARAALPSLQLAVRSPDVRLARLAQQAVSAINKDHR